jgi:hypothetical protein
MFSFGVQVYSTYLYIPAVSYHGTESDFNFLHCVGDQSAVGGHSAATK